LSVLAAEIYKPDKNIEYFTDGVSSVNKGGGGGGKGFFGKMLRGIGGGGREKGGEKRGGGGGRGKEIDRGRGRGT